MERFTISLPAELALAFDAWIERRGYTSRSEGVRDLVRDRLEADESTRQTQRMAIASLTYVYDHHDPALGLRLSSAQHDHHELVVATMHAHLDHERCLEVSILRGPGQALEALADAVMTLRGVRHGRLHLLPTDSGLAPWVPAGVSTQDRHSSDTGS